MDLLGKTIVVGMSGGVDSSVAALLLKKQGCKVIGMFMKNWEEKDENGQCRASADFDDVMRVCDQIQIPSYSVNFVKQYWDRVFTQFLQDIKQGHTPNPDILCNREIKFKALLEKACEIGGDYLATGHYCKNVHRDEQNFLLKGCDSGKDQSYFLYTLGQDVLNKVLFPAGTMLKTDLRRIAREHSLVTAQKKDSMGICFIGKRNFKQFLSQFLPYTPGNFETLEGKIVGTHQGAAYYTSGQRKGMGLGGPGEPWFVVGNNIEKNIVYVVQGKRHPALYCDELIAAEASWTSGFPPCLPFRCKSKIRYRQPDQECEIMKIENGMIHVRFFIPQRAVTQKQSIVFYEDETCLGGAIIQHAGPSYYVQKKPLPDIIAP